MYICMVRYKIYLRYHIVFHFSRNSAISFLDSGLDCVLFSPCETLCFLPSLSFSPHYRREGLREKKEGDEMTGCGGVSVPVPTCLCKTSVGRVRFVIVILSIIAIKQLKPGIHKNVSLCKGTSAIIERRFKGKGKYLVNMNSCSQPI